MDDKNTKKKETVFDFKHLHLSHSENCPTERPYTHESNQFTDRQQQQQNLQDLFRNVKRSFFCVELGELFPEYSGISIF